MKHFRHNNKAACGYNRWDVSITIHPMEVECCNCERTKAYKKADAGREAERQALRQAEAKARTAADAAAKTFTDADLDQTWNEHTKALRGYGLTEAEIDDRANAGRLSRRRQLNYLNESDRCAWLREAHANR